MQAPDTSLELAGADFRHLVEQILDPLCEHIDSLETQPAAEVSDAEAAARSLVEPLPEEGSPLAPLLRTLFEDAIPKSYNTASAGYLAYVPGGGLPEAAAARLIADVVNRYVGVWLPAPALVQLETNAIQWLCRIAGFPPGASGILTSGGSLANFSALVAARRDRLPEEFLDGTLYCSGQIHHSVLKAAYLAGFPKSRVREIATDKRFRMDLDALRQAIREDRQAGRKPFLVAGSAGTTNTGAVDDLESLADLARDEGLWLHIDGAYGGPFRLTERGAAVLRGMERADSLSLDPHKGLFFPYGTGALLVRDPETLRRSHSVAGAYMPALREDGEFLDFSEMSPELSRPFRGLAVWMTLKMHGIAPFRRYLDEKLDLTAWATEEVRKMPGMEIVAEPQLSVAAFRLHPAGVSGSELDRLNQRLLDAVNRRERVFLNGTWLDGIGFVLRLCVLSFRTHLDRVQAAVDDIRAAAAAEVLDVRSIR